ncbi:MAG: oligosaccharide flippase family protein [Terrimicrobiaceae bacterium]
MPLIDRMGLASVFCYGGQMVLWRGLALGAAAAGAVWAARCLGPDNMGISGMILSTATQLAILIDLNQNTALVRRFKECRDDEMRKELVAAAFTFRLVFCAAALAAILAALLVFRIPDSWRLGIIAGFPLVMVSCNQAVWLLQAQGRLPENYRAVAIPAVLSALLYFALFRPGIAAGSDVVVQAGCQAFSFLLAWWYALAGLRLNPLNLRSLRGYWPLLRADTCIIATGLIACGTAYIQAPMLLLLHSTEELGLYRTAIKLVVVAQSFLVMVSMVLYPRFIEWNKQGRRYLWERQKRIALAALIAMGPLTVLVFWIAPFVYRLAYGEAFARAAIPFAVLITAQFVLVVSGIFSFGLWAQHQDRSLLILTSVAGAASVTLDVALIPSMGMMGAAVVALVAELIILAGSFLLARWGALQGTAPANNSEPAL